MTTALIILGVIVYLFIGRVIIYLCAINYTFGIDANDVEYLLWIFSILFPLVIFWGLLTLAADTLAVKINKII
jgi:hypothetical protein